MYNKVSLIHKQERKIFTLKFFKDKQGILFYSIFVFMFILDQITKQIVISYLPIEVNIEEHKFNSNNSLQLIPFMFINHVVNFGGTWSIFSNNMTFIILYNLFIYMCVISYEIFSRKNRSNIISLSLGFILAGSGNFLDRIRLGYVTDFIDIRNLDGKNLWPIFNIADISLNIGIGLLILYSSKQIFSSQESEKKI